MIRRRVLFAGTMICLDGLVQYFASQHYFVLRATQEEDILIKAQDVMPDAIILDIQHLKDGFHLCSRLRMVTNVPIVIIDNKDDAENRIQALNLGADAFFVIPVNHVEVLTRIKALLRRYQSYKHTTQGQLRLDDLEVDFETNIIKVNDRVEKLTKTEIAVLRELVANPDKVLARTYLIDQVWGFRDVSDMRTVDTHIKKIRRILSSLETSWEIVTISRVGFRLSKKLGTSAGCSA